jgi:tRNA 2-thiouridine synthesizing protein A
MTMKASSDKPEFLAPAFDTLLDTSGLMCPEPVMLLHGAVRDVASGQVIKVVATDPSTERDIPKFCQFLNHELLAHGEEDGLYIYFIRRA